jgi:hypothetical protein
MGTWKLLQERIYNTIWEHHIRFAQLLWPPGHHIIISKPSDWSHSPKISASVHDYCQNY